MYNYRIILKSEEPFKLYVHTYPCWRYQYPGRLTISNLISWNNQEHLPFSSNSTRLVREKTANTPTGTKDISVDRRRRRDNTLVHISPSLEGRSTKLAWSRSPFNGSPNELSHHVYATKTRRRHSKNWSLIGIFIMPLHSMIWDNSWVLLGGFRTFEVTKCKMIYSMCLTTCICFYQ